MAVAIEEMTAEVTPPETATRGAADAAGGSSPGPSSPQQRRLQREQLERLEQRAHRVCAN